MAEHPDDSASVSRAGPGVIADEPAEITNIVHERIDGAPNWVLEKWQGAEWFYVSVDSLRPVEPADGETPRDDDT